MSRLFPHRLASGQERVSNPRLTLLPHFERLASFNKRLQPAQRRTPALVVALSLFEMTRKPRMAESHQGSSADSVRATAVQTANFAWFQFPAHDGLKVSHEISNSRMYE